ncbi:hypothetical protein GQ43DRAFT_289120 [Delitschia confertaspora ATCC 74209]|uniref:Methyltransferase domain-containing protein n=1 Tax=Delitschia confertaspora ATCC 74209 TaxID=1513339 RepID=A0A9P4JFZ1_9PLEO|nr:hypothetical protein GQ43DRAFT_289120 [Delitschia confertaspora ATCC 74209]
MATSTQNTQYDKLGTKYNSIHDLPVTKPEIPSVLAALGDIKGAKCLGTFLLLFLQVCIFVPSCPFTGILDLDHVVPDLRCLPSCYLACGTGRFAHLLHTLGASSVTGYDISHIMVDAARTAYPESTFPTLSFNISDCTKPLSPPPENAPFDLVFAGWFLNYAGTEEELIGMFKNIASNLNEKGRFVGITTNALEPQMSTPKMDFYGLDILVLDPAYRDPSTSTSTGGNDERDVLGIKARVRGHTKEKVEFDVFQFKSEVYERAARKVGLGLKWREWVLPEKRDDGSEWGEGYWERWLDRPNFVVVEGWRL